MLESVLPMISSRSFIKGLISKIYKQLLDHLSKEVSDSFLTIEFLFPSLNLIFFFVLGKILFLSSNIYPVVLVKMMILSEMIFYPSFTNSDFFNYIVTSIFISLHSKTWNNSILFIHSLIPY